MPLPYSKWSIIERAEVVCGSYISEEARESIRPHFRFGKSMRARVGEISSSSWHAAYKHINKLSRAARVGMLILKNTFTFVAAIDRAVPITRDHVIIGVIDRQISQPLHVAATTAYILSRLVPTFIANTRAARNFYI